MNTIRERFFLDTDQSVLLVIDVQDRLVKALDQQVLGQLLRNASILIDSAAELDIPIMVTEQYTKGLGETMSELLEKTGSAPRFEKMSFSCCGSQEFVDKLRATGRRQIVVVGMEAHVCVLQTALELLDAGYTVHLVQDAVMSRSKQNWKAAKGIVQQAGGVLTCTESVMFQWLKVAGTESFRKLSKLIK